MKIEIDTEKIVKKIDIEQLLEEKIKSEIVDSAEFEELVSEMLGDTAIKDVLKKKVFDIIVEYLSTEEGKKYVVERFEEAVVDTDILVEDEVVDVVANFLKKSLRS